MCICGSKLPRSLTSCSCANHSSTAPTFGAQSSHSASVTSSRASRASRATSSASVPPLPRAPAAPAAPAGPAAAAVPLLHSAPSAPRAPEPGFGWLTEFFRSRKPRPAQPVPRGRRAGARAPPGASIPRSEQPGKGGASGRGVARARAAWIPTCILLLRGMQIQGDQCD